MKNQILCLLIIISVACGKKQTPVYEQVVRSPIPEIDIPFDELTVDADSLVEMVFRTGSMVRFDPSSFETADGKPVKGMITVKAREFHKVEDLFRAGIPMSTDSTRSAILQSAGMIEVRAYQNGQVLKLKPGKQGYIELAGFRPSDGYSLYQLGDDVRWVTTSSFVAGENRRKKQRLMEIEQSMSLEVNKDNGFEIAADLSQAPYLKPYKGLTWEPVGNSGVGPGRLDLATAARMTWDSVKVYPVNKRLNKFRLVFVREVIYNEQRTQQEWSVLARPRLNGRKVDNLLREEKRIQNMMAEERQRLSMEADLVNTFRINQLGIWNIDKLMKRENTSNVSLAFDFAKTLDTDIQKVVVYMLLEDENSVITLLPKDWESVDLPISSTIRFVAILPGGKAVICDRDQVRSALKQGGKTITLKTRPVNKGELS